MLSLMRAFICLFFAYALFNVADAQTPSADPTKPSSDNPTPADKAPDSTVVTVKVPAPALNAATPAVPAETLKAARDAGYQIKTSKGGVTRFCKSESEIGSRFSKETCLNQDQLNAILLATQQERDRLRSTLGSGASSH